ncbi:MAG: cytochrome C oxidase subunit IV family protein [Acidimicrobiales bacterium]
MADPSRTYSPRTDRLALRPRYRAKVRRGWVAAALLAVLTVLEYVLATNLADPLWPLVPFMALKGWVILDNFMHVRELFGEKAH